MSDLQKEIGQAHAAIQRIHAHLKREHLEVTNLWLRRRQQYRGIPKPYRTDTGRGRYRRLCEQRNAVLRNLALVSKFEVHSGRAASHLTDARLAEFTESARELLRFARHRPSSSTSMLYRLVWGMSRWSEGVRTAIDPKGELLSQSASAPAPSQPLEPAPPRTDAALAAPVISTYVASELHKLLATWRSHLAAPGGTKQSFDLWLQQHM